MTLFIWGACAASSCFAGLFFWRFFSESRDRLFAMFALAFWALSIHWAALAIVHPAAETRHYFYVIRLVAFLLFLAAIVDKNRKHA